MTRNFTTHCYATASKSVWANVYGGHRPLELRKRSRVLPFTKSSTFIYGQRYASLVVVPTDLSFGLSLRQAS